MSAKSTLASAASARAKTCVMATPVAVEVVTKRLLTYCQERHWAGADPYDALNSDLLARFGCSIPLWSGCS